MLRAFRLLSRFKGLRGSALDIFSRTAERQQERQLIADYITDLDNICNRLHPANHAAAVALASVPDEVRGYGHVKEDSIALAKKLRQERLGAFHNPQPATVRAAKRDEVTV